MTKERLIELLAGYDDDEPIDIYELSRMMNEEYEERQRRIEEIEEDQFNRGFWNTSETIEMYRRER